MGKSHTCHKLGKLGVKIRHFVHGWRDVLGDLNQVQSSSVTRAHLLKLLGGACDTAEILSALFNDPKRGSMGSKGGNLKRQKISCILSFVRAFA